MKFTKTHGFILGAIVLFVVIYFLFFRKKSAPESGFAGFIVPGVPAFPKSVVVTEGKVKPVGNIMNTKAICPQGSHATTFADGSKGCIKNTA